MGSSLTGSAIYFKYSAVVVFLLDEDCSGEEGSNILTHIIKDRGVALANPVAILITPLTVRDARSSGGLFDIPVDSGTSPNRAGKFWLGS